MRLGYMHVYFNVLNKIINGKGHYMYLQHVLGLRRTSSNIQIKEATTIAAYVAYTHKPLRTNEVLGVRNEKLYYFCKLVTLWFVKISKFDNKLIKAS